MSSVSFFFVRRRRSKLAWAPTRKDMVQLATSLAPAMNPTPEASLLVECVEGDSRAWRQLHRRYHPVAAAFLSKLGVNGRELEDASQEVFLQVFRSLGSFRGEAQFETWLYRLCITQAGRVRRRRRVNQLLSDLLRRRPEATLISEVALPEDSARRRVADALSRLSPLEREAFVLFEMEGLPGEQVAQIVGCRVATLWRRLHDARTRFRQALASFEGAS